MTALYKVTGHRGEPYHGGSGRWSLPRGDGPGEWMPAIEPVVPCESGYHLCRGTVQLLAWLGPEIYETEARGEQVDADDKVVVAEARLVRRCEHWTEQSARLFAADCAARVLHLYERDHPDDGRPRAAIAAAREYARGEIGAAAWWIARDDAWDAARDAARAAAGDAARAGAWADAWDDAWAAARAAAGAAARAAARAAAGAGAWNAARDAERRWQAQRLAQYLRGAVRHDTPLPALEVPQ